MPQTRGHRCQVSTVRVSVRTTWQDSVQGQAGSSASQGLTARTAREEPGQVTASSGLRLALSLCQGLLPHAGPSVPRASRCSAPGAPG